MDVVYFCVKGVGVFEVFDKGDVEIGVDLIWGYCVVVYVIRVMINSDGVG